MGFKVNKIVNATYEDMRRSFLDFGRRAHDADMAIVYFAGHGIEAAGENWLIPIDARLESDTDVEHEAIALRSVVNTVGNTTRLGLVILDACRNNPFAATMQRKLRMRSAVARGFARIEPSDNVLVAYAAKDGTTAGDGTGRNSPFTGALVRHIETPGIEINLLFRTVRDDVMSVTQREQQPYLYGSLSKELIYLKGSGPRRTGPVRVAHSRRIVVEHDPRFLGAHAVRGIRAQVPAEFARGRSAQAARGDQANPDCGRHAPGAAGRALRAWTGGRDPCFAPRQAAIGERGMRAQAARRVQGMR